MFENGQACSHHQMIQYDSMSGSGLLIHYLHVCLERTVARAKYTFIEPEPASRDRGTHELCAPATRGAR